MLLDRIGPPRRCRGGVVMIYWFRRPRGNLIHHPLTRARALMARPGSARCYGVARQREGSRQNSIGGFGVLSLRHFSGWFSLSLGAWVPKKPARRSLQLWLMASAAPCAWVPKKPARRRMVSAGAMLLDRLGPPEFRFIDFRAPRLPYLSPLARARALLARPWSARCYGVARQREGSRQNSIGGSGVLSLRHFSGWFSLSLGAWVPKQLARRRMQLWLMPSAGAMLLDRLGPPEFRFNDFRAPRLPY